MKKLTLLIIPLLYALIAKAQVNQDSVVIKYKDKQRVIKSVENSKKSGTTIILEDSVNNQNVFINVEFTDINSKTTLEEAKDSKDSILKKISNKLENLPLYNGKNHKKVEISFLKNLSFGFVGSTPTSNIQSNIDLSPKTSNSNNISMNWLNLDVNLFKNRFALGTGFGFNHFNLNFENKNSIRYIDNNNYINQYTDSIFSYNINRQNIRYFIIPLVLKYRNKKETFEINAGIEYNFNARTRLVQKGNYEEGEFEKKHYNFIGVNEELITGILRIHLQKFTLFGRMSFTDLYQSKY